MRNELDGFPAELLVILGSWGCLGGEALGPTPLTGIATLPGSVLQARFPSENSYVKGTLLRTKPV